MRKVTESNKPYPHCLTCHRRDIKKNRCEGFTRFQSPCDSIIDDEEKYKQMKADIKDYEFRHGRDGALDELMVNVLGGPR